MSYTLLIVALLAVCAIPSFFLLKLWFPRKKDSAIAWQAPRRIEPTIDTPFGTAFIKKIERMGTGLIMLHLDYGNGSTATSLVQDNLLHIRPKLPSQALCGGFNDSPQWEFSQSGFIDAMPNAQIIEDLKKRTAMLESELETVKSDKKHLELNIDAKIKEGIEQAARLESAKTPSYTSK